MFDLRSYWYSLREIDANTKNNAIVYCELCGLEWSDIDFDNATITIARSLTAVRRVGLVLKDPKTNITMQIAAGVPIVTVAGRAGHARTSTTTDIYSHFLKTADRSAAQKLEEIFD